MNRVRDNRPLDDPRQPQRAVLAGAQALLLRRAWSPQRLAYWLRLDPVLCARLLGAWRVAAGAAKPAAFSLQACAAQMGRPLLGALIQRFPLPAAGDKVAAARWERALTAAAVARRLALAIGYDKSEEAYLAGLWRDADADALSDYGLGPFVAAAVRFRHAPLAELTSAHPLVRIVGAANWVVDHGDAWPIAEAVAAAAEVVGVTPQAFVAAVQRGRLWARQVATRLREARAHADASPPAGHEQTADAASLRELQEAWFLVDEPAELGAAVVRSAHLLFDCSQALLLMPDADGRQLQTVAGHGPPAAEEIALDLRLDGSVLAAAFRSSGGQPTVVATPASGLPVVDRQIIDLLDADGVICVPVAAAGGTPVALLVLGRQTGMWTPADDGSARQFAALAGTALASCHRRRERESRQLDKQRETLHRHARQVGHEIGNVLAVIRNYLAVLGEQAAAGQDVGGMLKTVGEEIDRAAVLQQQLSRPAPRAAFCPADVNQLVRDLLSQLNGTLFAARSIAAAAELDPVMPAIVTDAALLRQVLLNLCRNAAEAMGDGGQLRVATTARVNLAGRMFAEVTVRDSGPGIGAERMAAVFHEVGSDKGTGHEGLGLAIARSSMARLGGEIAFRNARGGGAEFSILVPWQPPPATVQGATSEDT